LQSNCHYSAEECEKAPNFYFDQKEKSVLKLKTHLYYKATFENLTALHRYK